MSPRPVEFTREALEDIDDLPEVARALSRAAESGRIVCGQSDPCMLELVIERLRVLYRLEDQLIVVLGADASVSIH
jgi:DNA-binding transcriptional LysR family regulator